MAQKPPLRSVITSFLRPYRALPRPVWIVFAVQIINRFGDFVTPFLSLFLTSRLGYDTATTGLFVTATIATGLLGTILAGKLSDHHGRKPILLVCLAISGTIIGLGGFLPPNGLIPWLLVIASFFQGALRPVISALIADVCPADQRKDAFSLSYYGINIGVAVGPMLAGFLFENHLPWIFWGDGLTTLIALVLVALFIPALAPADLHHENNGHHEKAQKGSALKAFLSQPQVVLFCLMLVLINFMYNQTTFGLPIYTDSILKPGGAIAFGWLMSFNAMVVLVCTPFIVHVTRKQDQAQSMALGTALYAIGFGMMAFHLNLGLLLLSTLLWSLGEIFFSINTGAYLSARTPLNLRGQFQAYREILSSLGRMLSPLVCGAVMVSAGIYASWALIGFIGIAATVGLWFMAKMKDTP